MEPSHTDYRAAWWGTDLPNVRPRVGTYGCYDYDAALAVPPPNVTFDGTFAWLRDEPSKGDNLIDSPWKTIAAKFDKLARSCEARSIVLPDSFRAFFAGPALPQRIRSCTSCFLDLAEEVVDAPKGDGSVVRFIADQQGCVFWYLFVAGGGKDHGVLASPDYFDAETDGSDDEVEEEGDQPAGADETVFCSPGFEPFVYRFWLENEFWYAAHGYGSPSPLARACIAHYGWQVPAARPEQPRRGWLQRLFGPKR